VIKTPLCARRSSVSRKDERSLKGLPFFPPLTCSIPLTATYEAIHLEYNGRRPKLPGAIIRCECTAIYTCRGL